MTRSAPVDLRSFEQWREIALPHFSRDLGNFSEYKTIPIHHAGPENHEGFLNLLEIGIAGINIYHTRQNPPYFHSAPGAISELFARESVAHKLLSVNQILSRFELELFILDAYRPLAVQRYFAEVWVPQSLRKRHPEKSPAWIEREVSKYWSQAPTSDEALQKSPPPHSTGAAIDLTIRFKETQMPLEMGSLFDDVTERSHLRYYEERDCLESYTESEAQKNRRLLHHVMSEFGFVAHPREWWHFSYGDQIWAYCQNKHSALYGFAGAPSELRVIKK